MRNKHLSMTSRNRLSFGRKMRYALLATALAVVSLTRYIDSWGECYAQHVYPFIASPLSAFSATIPWALGDLFIFICITGVIAYPIVTRLAYHKKWICILAYEAEFLLWIYVWFYLAWGLNYSQPDFYQRTHICRARYTPENFSNFLSQYIDALNDSYTEIHDIDEKLVRDEAVKGYSRISDTLGIHSPFTEKPKIKTMLFSSLASKVGISGSMGPFFCEFTINEDVLPSEYPATYTHELAHLLGITSEAEASFYAYEVCIRSQVPYIRFSGLYSIFHHVLGNARHLLGEKRFQCIIKKVRPEILALAAHNRQYWQSRYSPLIGAIQNWIYDLYLKGNHIKSGRKNYSEGIGIIMSYEEWKQKAATAR